MKIKFYLAALVAVLAIAGNAYAESLNVTTGEVNISAPGDAHLSLRPGAGANSILGFNTGSAYLWQNTYGASFYFINNDGVGWVNTVSITPWQVWFKGTLMWGSDSSLKEDIADVGTSLKDVMALRPSSYKLRKRDDQRVHLGFIAQDLEKVYPDMVAESTDPVTGETTKAVAYLELIAPLVRAVQEQQATIEKQQAMINALQQRVAKIEQK